MASPRGAIPRPRRGGALPETAPVARLFSARDRRFSASLRDDTLGLAVEHCIAAGRNETGGVIIGRYSDRHSCAEIHELGAPPHGSQGTRTTFYRGIAGLEELLRVRWREGLYYLGEWHFHPYAAPAPSAPDIYQIQAISRDPSYHCPEPLLIILGADPRKQVRLGVYVCPRGGDILRLHEHAPRHP